MTTVDYLEPLGNAAATDRRPDSTTTGLKLISIHTVDYSSLQYSHYSKSDILLALPQL